MGIYINKGNEGFRRIRNSEYVDKSGLIGIVNETLFTERCFSCVTRSRRFGKTMAAKMLLAYYDRSCDSRSLFADLKIASHPSFEKHLNKYPVISIDAGFFVSKHRNKTIVDEMDAEIIQEICSYYPDVPVLEKDDLMQYLIRVSLTTNDRFIFIIDEWDAILRECGLMMYDEEQTVTDRYVDWLRHLFKSEPATQVFAGVYLTGILPIKKYKTQSALNNFIEYSMVEPMDMGQYFGFTKEEVQELSVRHDMDFDELEKWYDGYQIGDIPSIFNPNSVMMAFNSRRCRSFWATTGSFDAVTTYIDVNYDGLKDDIICMLGGGRVKVNPTKFQNDLSVIRSKDDVLTVLIHLGYLSFNWRRSECYVPNKEVGDELANAVEESKWEEVIKSINQSERLLEATLRCNSDYVAKALDAAHSDNTSILSYNDENSLACVISLAYYYARNDYHIHREYPTGEGYADLVLIPRKNVDSPALVIELKYDKDTKAAISQIKDRNYPQKIAEYSGDILLVGINYDKETKLHKCQIERWRKNKC
jgi:hypothetical protein